MKIVCVSDTHGQHDSVTPPPCDLLLHAGDLSRRGTETQVAEFLDWFEAQPARHKVFIAGNHDFLFEKKAPLARQMVEGRNFIYLQDSGVEIDGLRIWGSPWQPWFFSWAFNLQRGPEIREQWDRIPADTDILITHGPPMGILDMTARGERVGCEELAVAVRRIRPRLHVFGHIHEAAGQVEVDGTHYVNASFLDLEYEPAFPPTVIELET